jgi:hypothetical protein
MSDVRAGKDGTSNDKAAASDGHGAGVIVYVLRQAGVAATAGGRRGVVFFRPSLDKDETVHMVGGTNR